MEVTQTKFTFQYLPGKSFNSLTGKDIQENLLKWSMKRRLIAQCFSFDQPFKPYQKDDFVLVHALHTISLNSHNRIPDDLLFQVFPLFLRAWICMATLEQAFMQDPNVFGNLKVAASSGSQVGFNMKCDKVKAVQMPCTVLSMAYFDRLYDTNNEKLIAREGGQLVKCLDDYYENITISDELRRMLLLEDSENYDLYSDTERDEFLFRLFKHICLGGAVCQYEDSLLPYLDTTKLLYKDLVSVQKDSKSGDLHITSTVFKIQAMDKDDCILYPCEEDLEQNFAYLVVDPLKRHVTVLYHKFGAPVFDQ